MIKKGILFFLFSFYVNSFLAYGYSNYVFVDETNVRDSPSIKGTVVGKLKHGTHVIECENGSYEQATIANVQGFWKPIVYNSKLAYIWEPNLAKYAFKFPDFREHFLLVNAIGKNEIAFKIFKQQDVIYSKSIKIPSNKEFRVDNLGRTHNSNGDNVIVVILSDNELEELYNNYDKDVQLEYLLFTWNGSELKEADKLLNEDIELYKTPLKFTKGIVNAQSVNIRNEPNSSAKIIYTSKLFEYVTIDSTYVKQEKIGESYYEWSKVTVNNKTGYIRSDYLSVPIHFLRSYLYPNEYYLYTNWGIFIFEKDSIKAHSKFGYADRYDLNNDNFSYDFNYLGHLGLNPNYRALAIGEKSFQCGQCAGNRLYIWDGKTINLLGFDGICGDGAGYGGNDYTFPTHIGGIEETILGYEFENNEFEDVFLDYCSNGRHYIASYEITKHYKYVGGKLVEIPSKYYYLREYLKQHYPDYDVIKSEFGDINGDLIPDAVFELYSLDYEKREAMKHIVGIVYGLDATNFTNLTVNTKILKPNTYCMFTITPTKILEMFLINDEDDEEPYVKKYTFKQEGNQLIWYSKCETTEEDEENEENQSYEDFIKQTKYFKSKKIVFENAW